MQKIWLVTGTSTGIGRAITESAAKAGHKVAATVRNPEHIQDLVHKYPGLVYPITMDVNYPTQIETGVRWVLDNLGYIDVLVNNAGFGLEGALEELSESQIRQQMETNFFSLCFLIQGVLPGMRAKQDGYIFNVASVAGLRGFRGMSLYNASKFAVVGLSEALAQELAPFNIKVGCIEPGPYRTDWAGRSMIHSEASKNLNPESPYFSINKELVEMFAGYSGKQPGNPDQIAAVVLDLTTKPQIPVHLLFGDEAIGYWKNKLERYKDTNFMQYYPHNKWDA